MKDRDWLNWVIGGLLVVLAIVGVFTYSGAAEDREAQRKAEELTQRLEEEGLRAPDADILVRTLGTDGGNVCDNPASALGRAHLYDQLTNGASHVGRRPVIVDRRVILGEALILETYCPDELDEFQEKFDDLEFDDTLEN
jgi:hypothetical protein